MKTALACLAAAAAFFGVTALMAAEGLQGRSRAPFVAAGAVFVAIAGKKFMDWFAEVLPDTLEHPPEEKPSATSRRGKVRHEITKYQRRKS